MFVRVVLCCLLQIVIVFYAREKSIVCVAVAGWSSFIVFPPPPPPPSPPPPPPSACVCAVALGGAGLSLQIQFSLKIRSTLSSSSLQMHLTKKIHLHLQRTHFQIESSPNRPLQVTTSHFKYNFQDTWWGQGDDEDYNYDDNGDDDDDDNDGDDDDGDEDGCVQATIHSSSCEQAGAKHQTMITLSSSSSQSTRFLGTINIDTRWYDPPIGSSNVIYIIVLLVPAQILNLSLLKKDYFRNP